MDVPTVCSKDNVMFLYRLGFFKFCYMQVAWVLVLFKISTYWMLKLCLRQQFLM